MDLVNLQDMSTTYVGYAYYNKYIWSVEFILPEPPENQNVIIKVEKFKLLSIEDENGKMLRKIPAYAINSEYYLRKRPLNVFLKRENLEFDDFYGKNKNKYESFTGQVTEYFEDGSVFLSYYLINGKLNGNFTSYYNKKDICEESYFINGVRHGKATYYNFCGVIVCQFSNGEIISYDINFSEEKIYDIYKSYYLSGGCNRDNNLININDENYRGTITLKNGKIISNTITFNGKIEEFFPIIPAVINVRFRHPFLSYLYK